MEQADPSKFAIMVEPLSETDGGGWLATVPALPCCMGDGETPKAALADTEAAIVEWHAALTELGQSKSGHASFDQYLRMQYLSSRLLG